MDAENGWQFSRTTWFVVKETRFNVLAHYHVAIIKPDVLPT